MFDPIVLDNTVENIDNDRRWIIDQISFLHLGIGIQEVVYEGECDYFVLCTSSLQVEEVVLKKLLQYKRHSLVKRNIKVAVFGEDYLADEVTWAIKREAYPLYPRDVDANATTSATTTVIKTLPLWIIVISIILYKWFE
jgi:hypothetical protein